MRNLAVLLFAVVFFPEPQPETPLPIAAFNDNHLPAGRVSRGTLTLALEIRPAAWHLLGPDKAPGTVLAFSESGQRPVIPGPLIRVPLGTPIRAQVTNHSTMTLAVHGLSSRRGPTMDSLVLAPGASGEARFTADALGTFFYWAAEPGTPLGERAFDDSQLSGALVVDPPGARASHGDRVFVLGIWVDTRKPDGRPDFDREFLVINGRPWPHTERLTYQLGDSVSWRLVNASAAVHPMHLHGFFYRVDARGDIQRDTTYWPAERRMVVTEKLDVGQTMTMAWSPNRPGGWIFHCHLNWHVVSNPRLGDERLSNEAREHEILVGHADHDPHNHVETGMGGLMLAMYVEPPPGWTPPEAGRRKLRLFVQAGGANGDTTQRLAYVLQEDGREPAPDSVRSPGSPLVLTRDEPTSIWVINRSPESTQVHWHGLELESPFDGVVGVGGMPGHRPPAILPGDSFEMRITPPRAGSFMYHTHLNEIRQMSRGLWGPFIVLEPGESWDPNRDHIFMAGEGTDFEPVLNGRRDTLPEITLAAGLRHRFRLMNVTMGGPNLEFWLVRDGAPAFWYPVARDGHELPSWQRGGRRAQQPVGIGETWDVEIALPRPGRYALELRSRTGRLIAHQPLDVRATLPTPEQQIAAAVLPLPEALRDGAAVLGYRELGKLTELRAGANGMICLADNPEEPRFHVACYHGSLEPFMARGRALRAAGITGAEVDSVRYREIAEGTLTMPRDPASLYSLSAPPGGWNPETNEVTNGRPLYVIYVPFATSESTGIPSTPAAGTPWLMDPGTPKAHIMFVPRM